ncbi:MAG: hypothetical protein HZC02_00850 [Candidatus Levybacteria bacterium]|nr:hypothetical protein [Candidatus Levybacteria bacterium]
MTEKREYMGGTPLDPSKLMHFVPDVDLSELARETTEAVERVRALRNGHDFYATENPLRRDSSRLGLGTVHLPQRNS